MEDNTKNLKLAVGLLKELEGLKGFPKTEEGLLGAARRFLAIVHDELMAGWLADEIADGCTEWPQPIIMRELYEQKRIPADGKSASKIRGRMEQSGAR